MCIISFRTSRFRPSADLPILFGFVSVPVNDATEPINVRSFGKDYTLKKIKLYLLFSAKSNTMTILCTTCRSSWIERAQRRTATEHPLLVGNRRRGIPVGFRVWLCCLK